MATQSCIVGQNGESRQLTFSPEVRKITRLGDMKDFQMVKSPSWPSSPTISRSDGIREPFYWTLGRKGHKVSDEEFSNKISTDETFREIHSILSGMDLAKYYLKSPKEPTLENKGHFPLRRSASVQPQCTSTEKNGTVKKPFLESIPPPPKTKTILVMADESVLKENKLRDSATETSPARGSRRQVNNKLKELTERLRPSSAPPSPHRIQKYVVPRSAPPMSNFSFFKDPVPLDSPIILSLSKTDKDMKDLGFPLVEQELIRLRESRLQKRRNKSGVSSYVTLPRTKSAEVRHEPRTLASLDLNINFDAYRTAPTYLDDERLSENNEMIDSVSRNKEVNENVFSNKNEKERDKTIISPTMSRRGSIKSNIGQARKADFDLNFSKYGSLNTSKPERRKSVGQKEALSTEINLSRQDSNTPSTNWVHQQVVKNNFTCDPQTDTSPVYPDLNVSKDDTERDACVHAFEGSKTVPALPKTFPNPLEEEIRTIAKLLDGKESLFLKLIQSSKLDSAATNQASEQNRSTISPPPFEVIEPTSRNTSDGIRKAATMPSNTERHSPSRVRAMTVPMTDPSRNTGSIQSSPPPQQKRFYKKRLRGPYGEMLENEMSKSSSKPRASYAKDLDFLKELENNSNNSTTIAIPNTNSRQRLLRSSSHSLDETHSITVESAPKRKTSANIPLVEDQDSLRVPTTVVSGTASEPALHIRSHSDSVKASSNWNVDTLLSKVLKQNAQQDTRTHIVGELYETELSYVESLQIIIKKYMVPLKSSDHSSEIEESQVDEIFCRVPDILRFHETFLETLKSRLGYWDTKQKIGDVFIDVFTRSAVVDTYIEFINNWKVARDAIKAISLAKPAFAKFLESTSREHKGKLTLDALLIMPVQRIPRYELLIKELLKHTPMDHPDYKLLLQAQKEVHDLAVRINKVEREALLQEQRIQKLKEVEQLIEGIVDLTKRERSFIKHDFVLIPGGLGMKKERCLFLFSDMLLITSIKKKGGAIRKTSIAVTASTCSSLESNKYKLLMKTPLHNVDIIKSDIEEPCVRTFLKDVSSLESDIVTLGKVSDVIGSLNCDHQILEEVVRDLLTSLTKQLSDKQASCSQLLSLDLTVKINDELENITLIFTSPEQRMSWEATFLDAKERLDNVPEKSAPPEFLCSLPLRKTRAGLQITCASAVVDLCQSGLPDLWICSSDGYVGQVSVLTFQTEPVIVSSNNVCNSRILCIAAVPGVSSSSTFVRRRSTLLPYVPGFKYEKLTKDDKNDGKTKSFPLDSDSDDDDYIDATDDDFSSDDANTLQPTMWLGTEDGCIYVFNCFDVRLQKPKLRMHHLTCIYDILHVNEKVFVSLANGEIVIYYRDPNGLWNTSNPEKIHIATNVAPISKMVLVEGKLWCSTLNSIAIIDTGSLELEHTFQVAPDLNRHISAIVHSEHGVWVTVQSSPVVHLYHSTSLEHVLELNISPPVTKMLSAYDEIIRQHKLACLRVTAICLQKNLLWIGTSAGVLLSFAVPSVTCSVTSGDIMQNISGMSHGHFGHVRFLTAISALSNQEQSPQDGEGVAYECRPSSSKGSAVAPPFSALVISGGDGCEDFGNLLSLDSAGRDDSTNHLLMWRV